MSVSIKWRPVSKRAGDLSGTSTTLQKFKDIFGERVGLDDVDKLRAIHTATGEAMWGEIADAIESTGGEIEVYGDW